MTSVQRNAWNSFKLACERFIGNQKDHNFERIVKNLIQCYHEMGCKMSLKVHFLHSHLSFFPDNLGDVSDEHEEKFYQLIQSMERNPALLADYFWNIKSEDSSGHKRQCRMSQKF